MATRHFKYGGSTAGRTLQCPAWVKLSENIPKTPAGAPADKGNLLHDCMEDKLTNPDIDLQSFLGREFKEQEVTQDDINTLLTPAWEAYDEFCDVKGIELELPEQEVSIDEDIGGTADVIGVNEDTVFIKDWKFGYQDVQAVKNPQGLFYSMCALYDNKTKSLFDGRNTVCIVIIQPQSEEGILKSYYLKKTDVIAFADNYLGVVDSIEGGKDFEPTPGQHCTYCPAAATCPAKSGTAARAQMLDPESPEADSLAINLKLAMEMESWVKQVKKFAHEQADLGLKIPGFKLVDKRAIRKWGDEDAAQALVRKARKLKLEDALDMELKSPAQLEKVCKAKGLDFGKFSDYIDCSSSGTTLVTEDDKRPEAVNLNAFARAITATE